MTDLTGKVAVVTGASSGIGEAIAVKFASLGAAVTLHGRDQKRLELAVEKCVKASEGHANRFLAVAGDITDRALRKSLLEKTKAKFGHLDILVPNAGVGFPKSGVLDCTEEIFDAILDVNLKSVFFLIQAAAPALEETKGCVVCVSSLFSMMCSPYQVAYCISKAAMDQMIRCQAMAYGPRGVRVNGVNPSFIPTRIFRAYGPQAGMQAQELANGLKVIEDANHPLEGRCGTPEEVADAVVFLGSSQAAFVTGENLVVDGGRRFLAFCQALPPK